MTTALQVITGAAKLINIVRKSEALTADEAADGLIALNEMLASWANNGLLVVSRVWESFSVSAASSYAIGSGQTLDTVRPIVIREAFFRIATIDHPIDIIGDEEYEQISFKTLITNYPQYLNYDNAYPYGTIRLYPQGSGELHLLSEKPITSIASLSSTVDFPPGWLRAIRYNLAIEIAGEYGQEIPIAVAKIANDSKGEIALAIAKNRPLKYRQANLNRPNIYSGYYA